MKENGVIRRRLSGKEADPYIGLGRKILGEMKNIMQMGGIKQLNWTKDLQNGVRIVVSSIFGQDEVRIFVPVNNPLSVANKLVFDEESDLLVIVGYTDFNGMSHATLWIDDDEPIDLGFITDSSNESIALSASADGSVVVGGCTIEIDGRQTERAFRWTKETGMQSIGALSDDQTYYFPETSLATGVSADGKIIVGVSDENIGDRSYRRAFIWTEETGMVGIGGRGGYGDPIIGSNISRNGNYIVGRANNINFTLQTTTFRYANNNWQLMPFLPQVGNDVHVPYAVSDNGVVVGSAGFFVADYYAFRWLPEQSNPISIGKNLTAVDISADGNTILLFNSYSSVAFATATVFSSWLWTETAGLINIGDFDAKSISGDAEYVVGASQFSNPYANGVSAALKWRQGEGITLLKQLTGHTRSQAAFVSHLSSKRKLEIEY